MSTAILFDYEKLNVPSKSFEFVGWVTGLLEKVSKSAFTVSLIALLLRSCEEKSWRRIEFTKSRTPFGEKSARKMRLSTRDYADADA